MSKTVVVGPLGTTLDRGTRKSRWNRWRPTVDLCRHDDLLIDRFELLHPPSALTLAEQVRSDILELSPRTEVVLHAVDIRDPWDFEEVYATLLDFMRRYAFDTEGYEYLAHVTTGTHVVQICNFLLTESRHFPGKLVQCSPPPRGTPSAPGSYRVIDLDLSRYDHLRRNAQREHLAGASLLKLGIPTRNAAFNQLISDLEQVAVRSTAPILLTGPTGVGKTQLAKRIYALKKQRALVEGGFVEVNCATLRGDGAMSTLFGHEKGAFTGADRRRKGLLLDAHDGLLFLDEVGELGLDEQAMLLRAVEEGSFLPMGADRALQSDFQLIAGTNRDLASDVASGRFREDLYSRINLWTFRLPPLRDRREDIEPNVEFELERYAEKTGINLAFSSKARAKFLRFAKAASSAWTGNFRDLGAAVERMGTFSDRGIIEEKTVQAEIMRLGRSWSTEAAEGEDPLDAVLDRRALAAIDRFDRAQLAAVADVVRISPTLSAAGRALFDVSREQRRSTNDADRLRKYLARFGLSFRELKDAFAK